ncbi:MAG TPA: alpha-amylase family protein [Armatimonadota bacterium]|jgi:hypothetical protein
MAHSGRWYPQRPYFGLHYDLHANAKDTVLGARCRVDELVASLKLMGPEWVQTDCKGHAGMTSWFSRVPNATVSPGVKKDALKCWREATRRLGVPLHCHYSGIWDRAAAEKHPEWAVVPNPKTAKTTESLQIAATRMCPRGGYLEGLLLPQMLELVDRYGVDGFWVDGEIWAVEPCYCAACRAAFREQTGIKRPPTSVEDPDWVAWINFQRQSFYDYVTRYVTALHEQRPEARVCSNWLHSFRDPGEPVVPTDWISGDNVYGLDPVRCEARFLSTRGRPWDVMSWNFFRTTELADRTRPATTKEPEMVQQEAATVLALGGNFQVYENAGGLRDGRLVDWRMKRLGAVGKWVKERRSWCRDTEAAPQVAVLHSEHHFHAQPAPDLYFHVDTAAVEGAAFALLENQLSVEILDEWALLPRLTEFPLVVVPEQDKMSAEMLAALVGYVEQGGKLLVTGAAMYDRAKPAFWGATAPKMEEDRNYYVPSGEATFAAWSKQWRLLKPKSARILGWLGKTPLLDAELTPYPGAVLNQVGQGQVAYVPWDACRFYRETRYPAVREWFGELVAALQPDLGLSVTAPPAVDVILRRKGRRRLVHLINRASGLPLEPPAKGVAAIPPVGPVEIEMRLAEPPLKVRLAGDKSALDWGWAEGRLWARVAEVGVHCAVVVE